MLTPEKKEHFSGLITPDGLKGIAFAVLTTSEIVLVDAINWKILIRQKHRRDLDPSLLMKTFSAEDGTHSQGRADFSYSNLPLLTTESLDYCSSDLFRFPVKLVGYAISTSSPSRECRHRTSRAKPRTCHYPIGLHSQWRRFHDDSS